MKQTDAMYLLLSGAAAPLLLGTDVFLSDGVCNAKMKMYFHITYYLLTYNFTCINKCVLCSNECIPTNAISTNIYICIYVPLLGADTSANRWSG